MNRNSRRQRARLALLNPAERVPVFGPDDRIVALVARAELHRYEGAVNATIVRERRTGLAVRVNLRSLSDDTSLVKHRGNPRRYSHDRETNENPPRVWTIRRLGSKDPDGEAFVQRIFRASVLDNLKEVA